jgi:chemotaxis protein CheX
MSPAENSAENRSENIVAGELAQIVESVFGSMLNLEARESGSPWATQSPRVRAMVRLTSGWNGAVLMECDATQACRFAARFLSMEAPDSVDDLVRDVLGELANMIGGNLKCILQGGMRLSLPSVVEMEGDGPNAGRVDHRLSFQTEDGPFGVIVISSN